MMTAGPWRLDALEILARQPATRASTGPPRSTPPSAMVAARARPHEARPGRGDEAPDRQHGRRGPALRAKLRHPARGASRSSTRSPGARARSRILERYLERTGTVLDLLAAGTLEAKRSVVNIASFMRFASDWQAENPAQTLAGFVDYLDAYKAAGGELPTSVELSEDVDGVRLMTLYQAKGLEFPVVVVPNLLQDEWPVREQGGGWFPRELLREQVPVRRPPHRRGAAAAVRRDDAGPGAADPDDARGRRGEGARPGSWRSCCDGAGQELPGGRPDGHGGETGAVADDADQGRRRGRRGLDEPRTRRPRGRPGAARRVMPLPTARERRLALASGPPS